jgi:hypothetical protein
VQGAQPCLFVARPFDTPSSASARRNSRLAALVSGDTTKLRTLARKPELVKVQSASED